MTKILERIDLEELETKHDPLWWQKRGLMFTSTGYGRKIPTEYMVKFNNRWRRIYCCIFSNAGTTYITAGDDWIVCEGNPHPRYS